MSRAVVIRSFLHYVTASFPISGRQFFHSRDLVGRGRMPAFVLDAESYCFERDDPEIVLIRIDDIAFPPLGGGRQKKLDHGGFDRQRMISVLRGIVSRAIIPPVEFLERPQATISTRFLGLGLEIPRDLLLVANEVIE